MMGAMKGALQKSIAPAGVETAYKDYESYLLFMNSRAGHLR